MSKNRSNPCKICALPEEQVTEVLKNRTEGMSFTGISISLADKGHRISQSSVIRHFQNHLNKVATPEPKEEPQLEDGNLGTMDLTPEGGEFKGIKTDKVLTDWTEIFLRFNLSPEEFEIVGDTVRMSSWQQSKRLENGDRDVHTLYSYRAQFRKLKKIDTEINLPALFASVRERSKEIKLSLEVDNGRYDSGLGITTCFSDLQAGKTDHRGGTPELLDRVYSVLDSYERYLVEYKPSEVVLADLGDIVEGFNSTAAEMFTNDLSIMDQVDLAHTVASEFLSVSAKHTKEVTAVAVPSNHAAWRKGKDYLGTPADDWGLHIFRMIEKEYAKYGLDGNVKFVYPDEYDKSVNVNLKGTDIGFTHGDDWTGGPKNAETWWQKQQHGGGPTSRSDILVHGHYHTFLVGMSGRTPEKRQKYIISASTLDSGSSWFANGPGGTDSEAGLTVFGVRQGQGLDLSTLRVLK